MHQETLEGLAGQPVGNGLPGRGEIFDISGDLELIGRETVARQAVADGLTGDAFKSFLVQRYPERKCPGIFDIYLPRLFGDARSF